MRPDEQELIDSLASFATGIRAELKGLTARVIWHLYAPEEVHTFGGADGQAWDQPPVTTAKPSAEWDAYVLAQGGCAIHGHMTGRAERRGGSLTGHLEEKKDTQYIHQLLPRHLVVLRSQCGIDYPSLDAMETLLVDEPHRASALLFFHSYCHCIYRTVATEEEELLARKLKELPGEMEPEAMIERWKTLDQKLVSEKRPAIYEFKAGQFLVYLKSGKEKRLINGWVYGIESEEQAVAQEQEKSSSSDYAHRTREAGFHVRMKALTEEAALLLGDHGEALVATVADHKTGMLEKVVSSVGRFQEMSDMNQLDAAQASVAKVILERLDKIAAVASHKPKLLQASGIDTDAIRAAVVTAQKLKRKLTMMGK